MQENKVEQEPWDHTCHNCVTRHLAFKKGILLEPRTATRPSLGHCYLRVA